MDIYRIVLTGGPCAGKTMALTTIKEHLRKMKIPCITIPETATELIVNGLVPVGENMYDFQNFVLKRQIAKEKDTEDYIKKYFKQSDKCVIIYDRGIFDNLAYLDNKDDFLKLLSKFHLSEIATLDKYDLVLDLLSLATCKPKEYNLDNEARCQTVEKAAHRDRLTSNAWANHRNMKVISSIVPLEEEKKVIVDCVDNLIKQRDQNEVVRYFVDVNHSNFDIYDDKDTLFIDEVYLNMDIEDCTCKISKRRKNGVSYILDIYKEFNGQKITFLSKKISLSDVKRLYNKYECIGKRSFKEINFVNDGCLCRLHFYDDNVILEINRNLSSNNYTIPSNIAVTGKIEDIFFQVDEKVNNGIARIKKILK